MNCFSVNAALSSRVSLRRKTENVRAARLSWHVILSSRQMLSDSPTRFVLHHRGMPATWWKTIPFTADIVIVRSRRKWLREKSWPGYVPASPSVSPKIHAGSLRDCQCGFYTFHTYTYTWKKVVSRCKEKLYRDAPMYVPFCKLKKEKTIYWTECINSVSM